MNQVINTEKIPIKIWTDNIEESALTQARNLANLPFAFSHIALAPDVHMGYGMPIGGILATKDVIIPNAVGSDIGCGMIYIDTNIHVDSINDELMDKVIEVIRRNVPVGFKRHNKEQHLEHMPKFFENGIYINKPTPSLYPIIAREFNSARESIGTLGGGNHFIEFQKDENGMIGIMIHSGSRNLGKQVADHYNDVAKELNARWFSSVDPKHDLAFLPIGTEEADAYIREMNYCVDFALANRKVMMYRIMDALSNCCHKYANMNVGFGEMVNIAHNYARIENHFGKNVWIHRKGATSAKLDETGIIPGSQGTSSYIVKGLGNIQSFTSCSHGAGRKMGRKEAQRSFNLEDEIKKMNDKGIIHNMKTVADLDESAGAYKDIFEVMSNQRDLVTIVKKLFPVAVIKG